jgi:SRSO17 transposase
MTEQRPYPGVDEYMTPFNRFFHRSEGRELSQRYIVGLIMEGERKSVEPMSVKVGGSERSMQRLLTEVKWDHEEVLVEYRKIMLDKTADAQGVLAVDDTGFPKKGKHTVCVARQYCPSTGKVDNCQIGVSLAYVGQEVSWTYGMNLFIPKSWDDTKKSVCVAMRIKTDMPKSAHHLEKWKMVLDLIDIANKDKVPHRAVVADSWYGDIPEFRKGLSDRKEKFVVGVHSDTNIFLESPIFEMPKPKKRRPGRPRKYPKLIETNPQPVKVSELGKKIDEDSWEHLELRRDIKGNPLVVEAFSMRVWPANGYRKGVAHEEVWLIVERRLSENGRTELRYFFSNYPQNMPTIEMVRLYHERFWIEHGYQQLKEELGLDHHEGRSWIGWHRHVLLVNLAYGYLTLLRLKEKKSQEEKWKMMVITSLSTTI